MLRSIQLKRTLTLMMTLLVLSVGLLSFEGSALEVRAEEPVLTAGEAAEESADAAKAWASGIAIAVTAGLGAIAMALAIMKANEAIARQPEAQGNIRTTLTLGLVFIETAIIYALIVAILIIFVL